MPMAVTVDEKELQEQVRSHAAFFDRLANLIPARFYVDSDRDPVNLRYLKKSARAQLKREYKEQYKKRKRAKLDPATADTTLTVQQRQLEAQRSAKDDESDASEDDAEQDERDQSAITENPLSAELPGLNIASEPADRESLRQRLAKRIEAKQKERSAKERSAAAEAAKKWKNSKHRKSVEEARKTQERRAAEGKALKAGGVRDAEEMGELEFSKVLHGKDGHHEGKKRKPSKQQQLQAAERAVEQRAQLGATPDAQAALRQEGLKKALKIASGEKVFDDPKLLKRSIKREERKRKKSSREWQQRSKQQQEQQASRQQRRQDNLQRKADQKKKRKIEKREKKLMSRAGFEGRTSKQLTPS